MNKKAETTEICCNFEKEEKTCCICQVEKNKNICGVKLGSKKFNLKRHL